MYLWNADSGNIEQLLELEGADYVCSVSWIQDGNLIAVGTSLGNIQVRVNHCTFHWRELTGK